MILLEFAAQGVRGVAPTGGRATLRPGYNVVAADGVALRRLLEALLYPDARDAETLPRAAGGPAAPLMRAGLTLVGNDRVTYRLVRDFAAGCQLHRFDAEKRAFALVTEDLAGIRRYLQDTVGVPPRARLGAMLALSTAELPSRQGGAGTSTVAPQRQQLDPEQARKRIAQLEAEREKSNLAEGLQAELDDLEGHVRDVEEKLRSGVSIREGLEKALQARAELDGAAAAAAALGDADGRLAAFEKASARAEEVRARVEAEREAIAAVEARGVPQPFWRDRLFWPGPAAGALLTVGGATAAHLGSPVRHVALLALPAFGWGAWCALQWVGALEAFDRVARRKRIVDEWEKKALGAVEKDAAAVRGALQASGIESPAELREAISRIGDADAVVAEWRRRVAEWEASPEVAAAHAELADLEAKKAAVEARLTNEVGGFVRDVESIDHEIRRLETEARAPAPPRPPPAAAPSPAARPGVDPLRALLERAAEEGGGTPAAVARAVAPRASQALAALSFQRLQGVQADDRGGVSVLSAGRPVPVSTLGLPDRDVVFLSVKLALLERALAGGKVVAIADDAFAGLSEGARRVAARLLKGIAKPGQLVHATTDPSFRGAADHAA